jgi:replicative superfamily II helicase
MPAYKRKTKTLTRAEKIKQKKLLAIEAHEKAKKERRHKDFLRKMGYHKRTKAEREEAYTIRYVDAFGKDAIPEGGLRPPLPEEDRVENSIKRGPAPR